MPRREAFVGKSVPMLAGCALFVWIAAPSGPSTGVLSAILAWIVYEYGIYQSRYLVNDALGYGEDRKIYGSFGVDRVPHGLSKKQVWVAAIIRSTLALALLVLIVSTRPVVEFMAVGAMLGSVVGYEMIRQHYRHIKSVSNATRRSLFTLSLVGAIGYGARVVWLMSVAAGMLSRTLTNEVYLTAAGFMAATGILLFVITWAATASLFTTKSKGDGYNVSLTFADRPHAVAALALFLPGPINIKGSAIPDQPLNVFNRNDLPNLLRAVLIFAIALGATCGAAISQQVPLNLAMVIGFVIGVIVCIRLLNVRIAIAVSIAAVFILVLLYGWQSGVTTIGIALVPYSIVFGIMTANHQTIVNGTGFRRSD